MTTFYLGIDASKGYADFVILDQTKRVVEPNFQIDDTFDGHCQLYKVLSDFLKSHPDSQILAGIESTGGYENNWYDSLRRFQGSRSIQTARLNPEGVHANSRAELKRNNTDQMSARNVAEYLVDHPGKVIFNQEDLLASVRKHWTFYQMLVKQRTQLYNQLEKLVYSASPTLLAYCKDGMPQWVLKLLVAYPSAALLARARPKTLAKIPFLTLAKASVLVQAAKQSVASAVDLSVEIVIKTTASQIIHLEQLCATQIQLMKESCQLPELELLTSFNGIGEISAIGLLLEIQTIRRFQSVKSLAAYFGLHPVYWDSGDGKKGYRMSKKGRKEPRRILFMVALNAIKSNPYIKEFYERQLKKGMCKMAALGVVMHKILRLVFGMLKHNKPFDPEIDRANQQKTISPSTTSKDDKKRRFQPLSDQAPISGRQSRQRKTNASAMDQMSQIELTVANSNAVEIISPDQSAPMPTKPVAKKTKTTTPKIERTATPARSFMNDESQINASLGSNRSQVKKPRKREKKLENYDIPKKENSTHFPPECQKKNDNIQKIIDEIKTQFFS